jgi:hypothetical protein
MTRGAGTEAPEKFEGIDSRVMAVGEANGKGVIAHQMPGGGTDVPRDLLLPEGSLPGPFIDAGGAGTGEPEKAIVIEGLVAVPPDDANGAGVGGVDVLG